MHFSFLYLALQLYNRLMQQIWGLVVLRYRNCSIANFPKEPSAVNTVKCVLKMIHKTGLTFNQSSRAMVSPTILSPYCSPTELAKHTKLKTLFKWNETVIWKRQSLFFCLFLAFSKANLKCPFPPYVLQSGRIASNLYFSHSVFLCLTRK